jgi:hypothetical protein
MIRFADFESRSLADLPECGSYVYAEDPSTEPLLLGWVDYNGPEDADADPSVWDIVHDPIPEPL